MISVKLELYGLDESITRPLLIQFVNNMLIILGIDNKVYTVYDPKDNLIKKKTDTGNIIGNNTTLQEKVEIDYDETVEEGISLSLQKVANNYSPIYVDNDIGTKITPINSKRRLSVNFRYLCKSKSLANGLLNKLRNNILEENLDSLASFQYFYLIPNTGCLILKTFNDLKNNHNEFKLPLEDYLQEKFIEKIDFTNTLDGNIENSKLAIREKQLNIHIRTEDNPNEFKIEYDESTEFYTIEMNYSFVYTRPVSLVFEYPIMIYNQFLPNEFIKYTKRQEIYYKNSSFARYMQCVYNAGGHQDTYFNGFLDTYNGSHICLPAIDKNKIPDKSPYYKVFLSVLVQIKEGDTQLFNINNLPNIEFSEKYYDFLISEKDFIGEQFQSLFYIQLEENDRINYNNKIKLDENGNLTTTYPLKRTNLYRVIFNIMINPMFMPNFCKLRIKNYCIDYLNQHNPKITNINSTIVSEWNSFITSYIPKGTTPVWESNLISLLDASLDRILNSINSNDINYVLYIWTQVFKLKDNNDSSKNITEE